MAILISTRIHRFIFGYILVLIQLFSFAQSSITFEIIPKGTKTPSLNGDAPSGLRYTALPMSADYSLSFEKSIYKRLKGELGLQYVTSASKRFFSTDYNPEEEKGYRGFSRFTNSEIMAVIGLKYVIFELQNSEISLSTSSFISTESPFNTVHTNKASYLDVQTSDEYELLIERTETIHPEYSRFAWLFGLDYCVKLHDRWKVKLGIEYLDSSPLYNVIETFEFENRKYEISTVQERSYYGLSFGLTYLLRSK